MAGTLVDRVGCQRVLSLGSLLMAVAFVLLARAASASSALVPAILLAAGGASINAASNTLVSVTYGERRGAMLSLMATFGASGALVAPLLFGGGLGVDGVAVSFRRSPSAPSSSPHWPCWCRPLTNGPPDSRSSPR